MWSCITFSCSDQIWRKAVAEELEILYKQKLLNCQMPCLVLEDPANVGSGGAILNALYATVEMLCNIQGFNNQVSFDVLEKAHVLILQHNNNYFYPPGMLFFPTQYPRLHYKYDGDTAVPGSGLQTYIEYFLDLCCQLKQNAPPGVWIISTDAIMLIGKPKDLTEWWQNLGPQYAVVATLQSNDTSYCHRVKVGVDETVQEITYNAKDNSSGELEDVASGIVYLKSDVAKILIGLCSKFPLDASTYLGEDSGCETVPLSLFELIGPLWYKDKESYVFGDLPQSVYYPNRDQFLHRNSDKYGRTSNGQTWKTKVRLVLWEELCTFKLHVLRLYGLQHSKWSHDYSLEQILFSSKAALQHSARSAKVLHSFVNQKTDSLLCINSCIESALDIKPNSAVAVIISSSVQTTKPEHVLKISGRVCILNCRLSIEQVPEIVLQDDCCVIGYCLRVNNESKMGRAIFSLVDIPSLECNDPRATIFGLSWEDYLARKGIESNDLWHSSDRSLFTAQLFPLAEEVCGLLDLLWLQDLAFPLSLSRLSSWRKTKRYSMEDFMRMCDPEASFRHLRMTAATSIMRSITQWPTSLEPYLHRACVENWNEDLLNSLDNIASFGTRSEASRALATVADLLACQAGIRNSELRSGPASNAAWDSAFCLLEKSSLHEGVKALADLRRKWNNSQERMLRAARHYERAVHILIRQTVKSVHEHMVDYHFDLRFNQPPLGTWVEARCPARIDLSGGWSDTPPICYEMGGDVVNIGITVNCKKPIGACGRRLETLELRYFSDDISHPIVVTSLEDVLNYRNPTTPGALFKAALVCAGVFQTDGSSSFKEQLEQTLRGGLELRVWSQLPQGSGLGTSSILASAILAVIYGVMGIKFCRIQLIHAALYVEQLLTTGGGWQDQVGGVMGGCNRCYSFADSKVKIRVEPIQLSPSVVSDINQRLLLIHTGKVRLARNLLQKVIRLWYAKDENTTACFKQLVENSGLCKQALVHGNLMELGAAVNNYWSQKKTLAPGCQPSIVQKLMETLNSFVSGQALAGAGGGGFYYAILKRHDDRNKVLQLLASNEEFKTLTVYDTCLDQEGLKMTIDGLEIPISDY